MDTAPGHGASWGNDMAITFNPANMTSADGKAREYNLLRQQGYSDAAIRQAADTQFGAQTDEDWSYLQGLASASTAGANPFTPQPLTNPFTYTPNPYLGDMAKSITSQVTDNLQRNILPGIGSAAIAAGGYGGSRQGVVEANALKDANQGLSNSLASLYGQDYNNAMSRGLQKYQTDQGYNLGLGNMGVTTDDVDYCGTAANPTACAIALTDRLLYARQVAAGAEHSLARSERAHV